MAWTPSCLRQPAKVLKTSRRARLINGRKYGRIERDRPPKSRRRRLQHRRKKVCYPFSGITCKSDDVFVQLERRNVRLMRRLKRKDWRRKKLSVLLQKKRRRDLFVIPQKISIYDYQTRTGRLG